MAEWKAIQKIPLEIRAAVTARTMRMYYEAAQEVELPRTMPWKRIRQRIYNRCDGSSPRGDVRATICEEALEAGGAAVGRGSNWGPDEEQEEQEDPLDDGTDYFKEPYADRLTRGFAGWDYAGERPVFDEDEEPMLDPEEDAEYERWKAGLSAEDKKALEPLPEPAYWEQRHRDNDPERRWGQIIRRQLRRFIARPGDPGKHLLYAKVTAWMDLLPEVYQRLSIWRFAAQRVPKGEGHAKRERLLNLRWKDIKPLLEQEGFYISRETYRRMLYGDPKTGRPVNLSEEPIVDVLEACRRHQAGSGPDPIFGSYGITNRREVVNAKGGDYGQASKGSCLQELLRPGL